jgi:hypothetical protein
MRNAFRGIGDTGPTPHRPRQQEPGSSPEQQPPSEQPALSTPAAAAAAAVRQGHDPLRKAGLSHRSAGPAKARRCMRHEPLLVRHLRPLTGRHPGPPRLRAVEIRHDIPRAVRLRVNQLQHPVGLRDGPPDGEPAPEASVQPVRGHSPAHHSPVPAAAACTAAAVSGWPVRVMRPVLPRRAEAAGPSAPHRAGGSIPRGGAPGAGQPPGLRPPRCAVGAAPVRRTGPHPGATR